MEALENICACLPGDVARAVQRRADGLTELRLRPGGRPQLCFAQGDELLKDPLAPEEFRKIAARMLEHSLYAWEDELRQGFLRFPAVRAWACAAATRWKTAGSARSPI